MPRSHLMALMCPGCGATSDVPEGAAGVPCRGCGAVVWRPGTTLKPGAVEYEVLTLRPSGRWHDSQGQDLGGSLAPILNGYSLAGWRVVAGGQMVILERTRRPKQRPEVVPAESPEGGAGREANLVETRE